MTHRERDLLRFIERFMTDNDGVAPTLQEMSAAIGCVSKSSAHRLLEGLMRQGHVRREEGYKRNIRLTSPAVSLAAVDDATLLGEAARRGLLRVAA